MILPVRISGVTKDGVHTAVKEVQLQPKDDTTFTIPKVITENGYQNLTVKVDDHGVLLAIQVERWDPTV